MSEETETLTRSVPGEIEEITAHLLARACDRNLRLATAESCTGGLIGALLTDVEGASHAFEGGVIAYTEAAKQKLLGVPASLLEECGAVSEPVAIAMAEGALERFDADIAFSVTGFASSKARDDEEAGLVHFALARRGGRTVVRRERFGTIGRGPVRVECLRVAVEMMSEAIG